ncbi:MAG: HemK/PrmC family methyltransferase, partial [Cyanobacteria bacterium P01_D01_bin.2]
ELVQHGMQFLNGKRNQQVVDVGTGSGIIALTLALETAGHSHTITATDISADALAIAKKNSKTMNAEVAFIEDDLLSSTVGQFDLIIANLPYIGETEKNVMGASVLKHEPHLALFSPDSGFEHIERLLEQAQTRLAPAGAILLEIGYAQGQKGLELCKRFFPHAARELLQDLSGHDRILSITRST